MLRVRTSGATVRGLIILARATRLRPRRWRLVVESITTTRSRTTRIEDVLFGITLHAANHNVVAQAASVRAPSTWPTAATACASGMAPAARIEATTSRRSAT